MSLINDALKRANQTAKSRSLPAETEAPMEPVAGRRGSSLSLVLIVAVVVTLGLAGWFFWKWWDASHSSAPAKAQTVQAAPPNPAPVASPALSQTIPLPSTNPPPVAAPAPTPAPAPVVAAPVAAPEPPPQSKPVDLPWPVLKLSGIFYSKTNPRALINGRTVGVDDTVEGIRVAKIESNRVKLEWQGQTKELKMDLN